MAVVQCRNAHYYDDEKYQQCPHCAALQEKAAQDKQMAEQVSQARQIESYAAQYIRQHSRSRTEDSKPQAQGFQPQTPNIQGRMPVESSREVDDERAVSLYQKRGAAQYTVGWLVCVEGEEYGRDFPLYAGFNRIGRSGSNDIVLSDVQISMEEHCSVIYEQKKNIFYLLPKAGSLVYVRDDLVQQAQEIESGEVVAIGETRLELVVFCKGERRWTERQ